MTILNRFLTGQHVEIEGDPIGITLTKRTGRIVRRDEWAGYHIVRLDGLAVYRHPNGEQETLFELREAEDK